MSEIEYESQPHPEDGGNIRIRRHITGRLVVDAGFTGYDDSHGSSFLPTDPAELHKLARGGQ